ncbi:MAG: thiol-disulfide isomerase/thioredoxin [Phenylobacterium sp.]|jgi:thiol-disulfide isomerase/thioredoxin
MLRLHRNLTRLILTRLVLLALVLLGHSTAFQAMAKAVSPKPATDFVVNDQQRLSDFKGKVVYIDFWASWCGPCRKSFPWLNKINQQYSAEDFAVLSINLDTERHLAEKFLSKYPAEFSITYDPEGDLARAYKVMGMPSSYLIDHLGNIVASHVGFKQKRTAGYEQQIEHLIQLKKALSGVNQPPGQPANTVNNANNPKSK